MAFATIDYNEFKQSSYRGIKLSYQVNGKKRTKNFNTGNFVVDNYQYMRFLSNRNDQWYKENPYITWSSSIDHFYMDGNKYHESYFDPETGEFMDWQRAFDDRDFDLYHDIVDNHKYPKVVHLSKHKNFYMVKDYVKRKLAEK